ncbi:MAG: 23S rRNA methyltransferase [Rhodocyclales bacterium]|nr:RlmE family RNA methyltransferase [Rhodocyclaceae bacterium]PWB44619.1 MAG: 23S rRNA methyltransferase [Rhodocyclales bacterium]
MKKHKTSKAWMHEHVTDHYVQRAKAEGWRSRAAFKLMEIDEKDRLLRPGMVVVDLGAAPGGWSQVATERVGSGGRVLALDLLDMAPVAGVEFIQGDFREDAVLAELTFRLAGRPVDLVISDMAPNISGIAATDQARSVLLAELALAFAAEHLKPGGNLLVKIFQGEGFDAFRKAMAAAFDKVVVRKPKSSRDRSSEVYLLGLGCRPHSREG